jgi:hypothetical protein
MLRALGQALARAGLTERAMRTCFGVAAAAHVPRALPHRGDPGPRPPRAALPLWLFCARRAVDETAARAVVGGALDDLIAVGLLVRDGDAVRAPVALCPIGPSIAVARVWPDDSSHHLIESLPAARVDRWLDLGSGPAFAPLAVPGRARVIRATDVDPALVDDARIGLALSGVTHVEPAVADLGAGAGPGWHLVTFNAPIPGPGDPILARFWAEAPALVAPGGEVVVHSVFAALPDLPGELVAVRYARDPDFAITRWRPGGTSRQRVIDVTLTPETPHVKREMIDAA